MIVEETREYLMGTNKINFDQIIQQANQIHKSFKPYLIDGSTYEPMTMDKDAMFCFHSQDRTNRVRTDITKYGLTQAAAYWGIPSSYLISLFDKKLGKLAVENIDTLNKYNAENKKPMTGKVLVSENVTEAVVSEKFAMNFPVCKALETIRDNIDLDRYIPNQVYLSKSKMHIRFVDFENKVKVGGEDMSVGFTVSSSDVGKSALKVNFFLYKFACQNGIVIVGKSNYGGRMAGTLYRQKHIGEAFDKDSIKRYIDSFSNIELLRDKGLDLVAASQTRMMSEAEMLRIIESCKKVTLPDEEKNNILKLASERYGRTKWGLINGITEIAQDRVLDDRLALEVWAGDLLQNVS